MRTALLAFVMSLAACGASSAPSELPPPPQADSSLGPGDLFQVRVYGEEELSNRYRVAEDGTIDFPLVGRIEVAGLEPPAVSDLVAARLRQGEILLAPQVSVLVEEYNSKRISVIGAVAQPGSFPMTNGMTVVEAITSAGGFTNLADQNGTVLTRRNEEGELERYRVPVKRITEGRSSDVPMQNGDIIYVPERVF
ncbi:MAG TPA: polysaccharide biosynthesis/export family protein [Polyangiaceae bacterium LLY-WYZ-15_(1-7)]|nr:polysaccharide biosynthesis/export family protein [Polyangiaceae bacterium LLY-WYZ-15_(1-7)]